MKTYDLTYQHNLRDLGGMKTKDGHLIKHGRLYRSGHLHKVNDSDIKILNSLHLTDIIDFRGEGEFLHKGDYPLEGVKQHNYPALTEDINKRHIPKGADIKNGDFNLLGQLSIPGFNGEEWMSNTYIDLVDTDVGIKAYTQFFSLLSSKDDGSFLWHCSQGKDRAGLAAYFLEIALGVSQEDALEDYLYTQKAMELKIEELKPMVKRFCGNNDLELGFRNLREVFSAKKEYLDATIEHLTNKYGSVEKYIEDVLKADIKRLRIFYLD